MTRSLPAHTHTLPSQIMAMETKNKNSNKYKPMLPETREMLEVRGEGRAWGGDGRRTTTEGTRSCLRPCGRGQWQGVAGRAGAGRHQGDCSRFDRPVPGVFFAAPVLAKRPLHGLGRRLGHGIALCRARSSHVSTQHLPPHCCASTFLHAAPPHPAAPTELLPPLQRPPGAHPQ